MGVSEENEAIAEAKKKAGNDAFAKKDLDEAVRLYSEAIELDPSSYIYRSNRSACYALQGKHEMAREEAEACIKINPDFTKGYYRLATAQTEMGEIDAALETVKAGLGRDPKNGDLLRQKRSLMTKKTAASSKAQRGGGGGGGPGGGRIDPQVIQEFQELSVQLGLTKRELAEVEAQLQATLREKKRGVLTRGELDRVEDGTPMYQSVGKMFLSQTKEEVTALLDAQQEDKSKSETQLQSKQSYLEKRLASEQGNLNEIIKNIQAQG
ncbi:unnamed protein product [Ectocarpus sp. 12 AP-2014]